MAQLLSLSEWNRLPIGRIEDLSDAVHGAGLEATQMARGEVSGGLAFAEAGGMVFTSGLIDGRVALAGPLSQTGVTLGIGLTLPPGARQWLSEVTTGEVAIFHGGDEHDSLYEPGSLYATVTLPMEVLEAEAAERGVVLDGKVLGGTRLHARRAAAKDVAPLRARFGTIHAGGAVAPDNGTARLMLDLLIRHLARPPITHRGRGDPGGHGRVFRRARAFIHENLAEPISVDEIAEAAGASRRTLFRAFAEILGETPFAYVRRLRLHRIRHDLASDAERACTIALVAVDWGMSDLGRMAGAYRALFGERPSETLAKARAERDAEHDSGTHRIDRAPDG